MRDQEPGAPRGITAARTLRERLRNPGVVRLVGAHDALGARLGELAGFDGIWASGLEIAASHCVPDAGILSLPDFLAAATAMVRAIRIPVVADCDSGFGNALNVMHAVRHYEAAGVAAICLEDKAFPKINSLLPRHQPLTSVEEFVGKIEAAKCAQDSADFVVIARVEALIAGLGQDEALRRANAYADAGADAILIHDKSPTPAAIVQFCRAWTRSVPLIVVPTTYSSITVDDLAGLGVRMVIYANHGLRARIAAVREVFARILDEGTTAGVEHQIASISSIFELQGYADFELAELSFVRSGDPSRQQTHDFEPQTSVVPSRGVVSAVSSNGDPPSSVSAH